MKNEILEFIRELKKENDKLTDKLNKPGITEYQNTVYVHKYNNTLEIIKRLEVIVNK